MSRAYDWNLVLEHLTSDLAAEDFKKDAVEQLNETPLLQRFLGMEKVDLLRFRDLVEKINKYIHPTLAGHDMLYSDLAMRDDADPEIREIGEEYLEKARALIEGRLRDLVKGEI